MTNTIPSSINTDQPHGPGKAKDKQPVSSEVLRRFIEGDHNAFEIIYLRYREKILAFINVMIHSHADAEELTQELFETLYVKRGQIDPEKNFNAYLYRMARNSALKYCRNQQTKNSYLQDRINFDEEELSSEELIYAEEMRLLVMLTVSRMPSQRRKVFEMSNNEGLSNDEIASRLNISKNAVERYISHARRDIKKVLFAFTLLMLMQ